MYWVVPTLTPPCTYRSESLFRKHRRSTQQQMVVRIAADRAPEIGALEGVDVLGGAHIDSALHVRRRRIEERRSHCVLGCRLSIREYVRWIERGLRAGPGGNHNLDGDDVGRNGRRSVAGRRRANHRVAVVV